ncbi:pyridoxal-phosphate dependent enzyme, partial [Staphylococcus pseudintermedius]|uniref:pyridoxal-phosphate dependent enzyme n=1 Tax=Staphylococcus pseudintermedius TaxID=283734 RepID=UPI000D906CCE
MYIKTTPVQDKYDEDAYLRLKKNVKETPLGKEHYVSQKSDCSVCLKSKELQWVRSFKLRGAYNAIAVKTEEKRSQGITCGSAGN